MALTKNLYRQPFPKNIKTSPWYDSPAHTGPFKNAIDFSMPEGTPVLTPADGEIWDLKSNSKRGGPDEKFKNEANYITIKHDNNEYSQLIHLKYKSVTVKVGEKVKEGQIIGHTGSTGWTTQPHLHFMVFKLLPQGKFKSLKIRFK